MSEYNQKLPSTITASSPSNALATAGQQALVQRTLGEVQIAVMMAKQFPRDKIAAKDKLLNDCTREGLAAVSMYSYSRGGTEITGPSIRLAEAAKRAWGNMQSGWREVSRSVIGGVGISEVEAFAWDTESNTRESVVFTIRHWRDTKQGGYALKEERDIYELCANQAARRERACILKMIDGDVIEEAVKQCHATLVTKVKATPENIKSMVKAFADDFNVSEAQIEKRVQRRVETINGAVLVALGKIYNSLKDGMSKAEDWFEPEEKKKAEGEKAKKGNAGLKDKLADKAKKAGADPETGELPKDEPEKKEADAKPNAEPTDKANGQANATPDASADASAKTPLKAITLHSVEGNAAAVDFERWKLDFMKGCNASSSLEEILAFHNVNIKVLNQIKTRAPVFYDQCERCYNDNCERLKAAQE